MSEFLRLPITDEQYYMLLEAVSDEAANYKERNKMIPSQRSMESEKKFRELFEYLRFRKWEKQ